MNNQPNNDFPIMDDSLNHNGINWRDFYWCNPTPLRMTEEQKQRGRQAIEDSLVWENDNHYEGDF